MKKIFTTIGVLSAALAVNAQTFTDNFESYTVGQYIGAVSPDWTTWSGATGGAEDTQVTSANANSGSNSVYFSSTATGGGPQDCVLPFGGVYNTGNFSWGASFFVNSTKNAYFNFQAVNPVGTTWSLNVNMNSDGTLVIDDGIAVMLNSVYTQNTWFDLRIDINLNSNVWELFINNVSQGTWSNGVNSVASVDLFPINGSQFYVDDVMYNYTPYTLPSLNGAVTQLNNMTSALAGQTVNPSVVVRNLGTTTITSFDLDVTYNGNTLTENITGVNIASLATYTVNFTGTHLLVGGSNNAVATIYNVNGTTPDGDPADDVKTVTINPVVPATGKMVVGEEGTGTWCGWCPRGAVFMEMLETKYGDFWAGIAVHNGTNDPMVVTDYDAAVSAAISGYPSGFVDRLPEADPSAFEIDFLQRITVAPKAFLINGANWNATTRVLNVSVSSDWQQTVTGDYRIVCVLTEDNVTGTTSGYAQTNYYAGGGNGVMGGYEALANPVPASQMVYDHVARDISPDFDGVAGNFPGTITSGSTYDHNFTFTLPAAWDENEIHIVGLLIDPTGKIDNAASATITEAVANGFQNGTQLGTSVLLPAPDAMVTIYPNPSAEQASVLLNLTDETEVTMEIFSVDGKLVASKNYGKLNGAYTLPVIMNDWAAGVYTVKVTTSSGVVTQKLVKQ
ncbi:MAG: Omp28-related outer membrane protein [Bacteroidota bacterium]